MDVVRPAREPYDPRKDRFARTPTNRRSACAKERLRRDAHRWITCKPAGQRVLTDACVARKEQSRRQNRAELGRALWRTSFRARKTCRSDTGFGADDGIRTRDPHLGKVVLYQLSHVRVEPHSTIGGRWSRTRPRPSRWGAVRPLRRARPRRTEPPPAGRYGRPSPPRPDGPGPR